MSENNFDKHEHDDCCDNFEARGTVTGYGRFRDNCFDDCDHGCHNRCGHDNHCDDDCHNHCGHGCHNECNEHHHHHSGFDFDNRNDFDCCMEKARCKCSNKKIFESLECIKKGIEDDRRGVHAVCNGDLCGGIKCIEKGICECQRGINELIRSLRFAGYCFDCDEAKLIRHGLCLLEKGQREEIRGLNDIRRCRVECGVKECEKGIRDLCHGVEDIEKALKKKHH